jgi:hypothetical protein
MKRLLPLLLLALSPVHGQTGGRPINDGFSNTIQLAEREGSYANQGGRGATAEFGEPAVAGAAARHTVWYSYSAPANGRCVFDLTDTQGLRAELRFPGNPAPTLPLQTIVDGTSNTLFPDLERLSVDLDRGQTVYLVVDAGQPFDVEWRFAEVVNDHWQDAETLPGSSGTVVRGNSGGALDGTSNTLFISERNQVTVTQPGNPLGCAIKMDPKTGTFSGKIRAPGSSQFTSFYGVFHQGGYGYGLGFFPGGERTGEVVIDDF